jgi:hypothetical protein
MENPANETPAVKKSTTPDESPIVKLWSAIFNFFSWISIFNFIRWKFPKVKASYNLTEYWVLFNLALSVLSVFIHKHLFTALAWIILIYGFLRVFEVVIYQVNVLLFDKSRSERKGETHSVKSFTRIVVLLFHNYVEVVFWFSYFFLFFSPAIETGLHPSFKSIGTSFYFMTSFGTQILSPSGSMEYALVFCESAIGLFMSLTIISRFVSLIPPPETQDESEK